MPVSTVATENNLLLDLLPATVVRSLLVDCQTVELDFDQVLAEAGAPIERVLFPSTAIISLTAKVQGQSPLEMGMIGFEGMLGATLVLGVHRHPSSAIVQGSGIALAMSAAAFQAQLKRTPTLKSVIEGYLFVLGEQLGQTAACNAFHEVPARLARWLLMMDDRARGTPLVLTHLFLSDMLGVRRSAVTIAAGHLQKKQLIRYTRGHIQVLSRSGLAAVACECYSVALEAYQRQLGPLAD